MKTLLNKSTHDIIFNNIIDNVKNAKVYETPYPHLLIDNLLPIEALDIIKLHFKNPKHREISKAQGNARSSIGLGTVYEKDSPEAQFQDYLNELFRGPQFIQAILSKFQPYTESEIEFESLITQSSYPIRSSQSEIENVLSGVQSLNYDIQPGINPITFSGLEPHIDAHHKLIAGLLYVDLNSNKYDCGGALVLHKSGRDTAFRATTVSPWYSAPPVKRIDYKDNRLVVLLNSQNAIHSAEAFIPSGIEPEPRCLINIIVESSTTDYLAYDPRKLPQKWMDKLIYFVSGMAKVFIFIIQIRFSKKNVRNVLMRRSLARIISDWKQVGFQRFSSAKKIFGL